MALSSPISQSSAAAVLVDQHQLQLLRQPRHSSLSSSPSSYSNPSPYSTPSSDDSITSSLKMQYNGRDENNDEGGRWVAMARAAADDGGGNGGGVLSMLQKAFCSNLFASSPSATYRSVLTRASMDSGLELDEMEKSRRDERRKQDKRREGTREEEEEQEKMMEEGESGRERENESEKAKSGETTADAESAETERAEENKKRRSIGRLFSLLLFPSANSSPAPFPMFDFPALPSSTSFALSSPVAQLSHSNAVLIQENERLNDRVGELELMLRDHVAHINSIYHSLHSLHGFHALQLPDGELVHLSQFQGFPLRFICTKTTESEAIVADEEQHRILEQATDNSHTVGQARRFMLQQRQRHRQQQGSVNESLSSGSSSSFASSSSTFDSSLAADPTDFSLAMMRRLCIRPVARDDSEEMQAFMEWLKSGDSAGNESIANGDFSAPFSVTKSCAWPKTEMDAEGTSGTESKQSAEHEAASANGASVASSVAQRSQRQPPVYSVMSKSQRMRTQCPSLSSRRRSPLLSPASSSSSASFLAAPSSPSSATFTHHGGFGGGGGSASGADETAAARSPRRSGIGITNMKRMGSRPSDAQKSAKRHLI
ncbi:hypothetical protein niasHT_027638 [Heterodera trifolii]|uniref:Uncharacterized protein n=1 Tax=Heterodera trifolii TaxID=157864 RepID=A0ABD2K5U9_9BILA